MWPITALVLKFDEMNNDDKLLSTTHTQHPVPTLTPKATPNTKHGIEGY